MDYTNNAKIHFKKTKTMFQNVRKDTNINNSIFYFVFCIITIIHILHFLYILYFVLDFYTFIYIIYTRTVVPSLRTGFLTGGRYWRPKQDIVYLGTTAPTVGLRRYGASISRPRQNQCGATVRYADERAKSMIEIYKIYKITKNHQITKYSKYELCDLYIYYKFGN